MYDKTMISRAIIVAGLSLVALALGQVHWAFGVGVFGAVVFIWGIIETVRLYEEKRDER